MLYLGGEGKIKKIWRKCATVAPYLLVEHILYFGGEGKIKKIRRKCATVAPYLAESKREC